MGCEQINTDTLLKVTLSLNSMFPVSSKGCIIKCHIIVVILYHTHSTLTWMYAESSFEQNRECDVCLVIFELLDFSVSVVQFPALPAVTHTHTQCVHTRRYTHALCYWQNAFIHRHLQRPLWPLSQKKENDQYPS